MSWRTADAIRTIAIEDPDRGGGPGRPSQSVGLDGYVNTSYPKGLVALLEDRPPRVAVIDVGTNSVKFHVGERVAPGHWRTVVDRADVTRLGEGIDVDRGESARRRATGPRRHSPGWSTRRAVSVPVGSSRWARPGCGRRPTRPRWSPTFRERSGIRVQVISGEEEARLAYVATVAGLDLGDRAAAVFDTGGGSTQFTYGHGTHRRRAVERPDRRGPGHRAVRPGRRRRTGGRGSRSRGDRRRARAHRGARAAGRPGRDGRRRDEPGCGQARPRGLRPGDRPGHVLDRAELDRQIERYRTRDADGRREIVGLQPQRAEVILAGALHRRA